jgi:hypothetical protein
MARVPQGMCYTRCCGVVLLKVISPVDSIKLAKSGNEKGGFGWFFALDWFS